MAAVAIDRTSRIKASFVRTDIRGIEDRASGVRMPGARQSEDNDEARSDSSGDPVGVGQVDIGMGEVDNDDAQFGRSGDRAGLEQDDGGMVVNNGDGDLVVSPSHASVGLANPKPSPAVQILPRWSVSPCLSAAQRHESQSNKRRNLSASPAASQQPTQQHKWQCAVM